MPFVVNVDTKLYFKYKGMSLHIAVNPISVKIVLRYKITFNVFQIQKGSISFLQKA